MSATPQPLPACNLARTGRIATFDVAKGLAVLLMIMIHVLDFYALPEVRSGTFGSTLKFAVGWPAASMFVFIMHGPVYQLFRQRQFAPGSAAGCGPVRPGLWA